MSRAGGAKGNKPVRVMAEWKAPADIYDPNAGFEIDSCIRALMHGSAVRLSERWDGNASEAIKFARRALELAIIAAQTEVESNPGPMIDRWRHLANAARGAHKATHKLMRALTDEGPPYHYLHLVRGLRTARVFIGSPPERFDASIYAAQSIFQIADLMEKIADAAQRQKRKIAGARQNDGDPAARAFAQMLAEAWIALTDQPPSSHEDENANPFLRFLIAAWKDAGGTVNDAGGGVGTAFKRMTQAARHSLDPERVQDIQNRGLDAIDWK